jgi:hypothetical protein
MVGAIVPVGNGQAMVRRGSPQVVGLYLLGSLIGAGAMGWTLTSIGGLMRHRWLAGGENNYVSAALGLFFLLASVRAAGVLRFALPQSRWQVPRIWLHTMGERVGAFAFGSVLGASFFNPVVCISFYAVVLWIVLMAGRSVGLLLALLYVTGRVLPVLGFWYVSFRTGRDTTAYLRVADRLRSVVFVYNAILLAGLGSFLLTVSRYR